jgi:glycine cleavage system H protein
MTVYRGCDIPPDLLYDVARDVWIRPMPDGSITLGMTDAAQTRSGKVLHILFKKPGRHLDAGQSAATIESAKWAGPFPTPVAGTVVETNEATFAADVLIANRDPYGAGWISRLQPDAWPAPDAGLVTGEEAIGRYRTRIDELELSCFRCAD